MDAAWQPRWYDWFNVRIRNFQLAEFMKNSQHLEAMCVLSRVPYEYFPSTTLSAEQTQKVPALGGALGPPFIYISADSLIGSWRVDHVGRLPMKLREGRVGSPEREKGRGW